MEDHCQCPISLIDETTLKMASRFDLMYSKTLILLSIEDVANLRSFIALISNCLRT
ncbi:hypothetical protein Hanom_Chr12g01093581 [Helianthus anomalus]